MHHGNRPAQNQPNRIGVGGVSEIEAWGRSCSSGHRRRVGRFFYSNGLAGMAEQEEKSRCFATT